MQQTTLPRYDLNRTYQENYAAAPEPVEVDVPSVPGDWRFCGLPVDSPLGIPAGPLLNGKWILYYAGLGFDVLTYKTVRSLERECYPLPNLVPVQTSQLTGRELKLADEPTMSGSWAVSFGMPSKSPDVWRADVEWTRNQLPKGKVLSVSVVGSIQPDWSLDDLADDYARCARCAVESGADAVETNFSCPNVSTCDGQLYQEIESAALVAQKVRAAIGTTPYSIKIGHVTESDRAAALLDAISPYANALAMTNSVATHVESADGQLYFDGQQRGICGAATRTASLEQTRVFSKFKHDRGLDIDLIGVGGVSEAAHVTAQLEAGAASVQIATAAMCDPMIACRIRGELGDK
jgi:dihydroorotate dehydrogenase